MMATIGGQEPLLGHPHPGVGKRGRGGDRLHRVHRGAPQTLRQRFRYSELEMDRISCHFYKNIRADILPDIRFMQNQILGHNMLTFS